MTTVDPASLKDAADGIGLAVSLVGISVATVLGAVFALARHFALQALRKSDHDALGDQYELLREGLESESQFELWPKSIAADVSAREERIKARLRTALSAHFWSEIERLAPGSQTLSQLQLLDLGQRNTLALVEARTPRGELTGEKLVEGFCGALNSRGVFPARIIVLGSAGFGKSFLTRSVFYELQRDSAMSRLPILVDRALITSSSTKADHAFGSGPWLVDLLVPYAFDHSPSDFERVLLSRVLASNAVLIVDGLDELLDLCPPVERSSLLAGAVLRSASWISCRVADFVAEVESSPAMAGRTAVHLNSVDGIRLESLASAVAGLLASQEDDGGGRFNTAWQDVFLPHADEIVWTPLLLLMAIEGTQEDDSVADAARTAEVQIYDRFVSSVLRRELAGEFNTATAENLRVLLHEVAAAMAGYFGLSPETGDGVGVNELLGIVEEASRKYSIARTPALDSLLEDSAICGYRKFARLNVTRFAFSHKSFQEYLVADRLYSWLLGLRRDGAEFFDHLETPGISHFVKEFIERIKRDPRACDDAVVRMAQLFDACRGSSDQRDAAKFRLGQIAYYAGMLIDQSRHHETYAELRRLASSETNLWVKHAVAVGLAFSGDRRPLDEYLDRLREAAVSGQVDELRQHLAIQLAFYGDRKLTLGSAGTPPILETCKRIVSQISKELNVGIEMPNRRMAINNLIFLAKYIPEAKASFESTAAECAVRLQAGLARARQDDPYFGEAEELREVVSAISLKVAGSMEKKMGYRIVRPQDLQWTDDQDERVSFAEVTQGALVSAAFCTIAPSTAQKYHRQDRTDRGVEIVVVYAGKFSVRTQSGTEGPFDATSGPIYIEVGSNEPLSLTNVGATPVAFFAVFAPPFKEGEITFLE